MSTNTAQILEDALKLPENERADLAACLVASLDDMSGPSPEMEAEIRRRLDAIDSGDAKLVPWQEARKRIFGDAS